MVEQKLIWTRAELFEAFLKYDRECGAYQENTYEGEAAFEFLIESDGGEVTTEERARFMSEQGRPTNAYVPMTDEEFAEEMANSLEPPKWVDISSPEEIAAGITRKTLR